MNTKQIPDSALDAWLNAIFSAASTGRRASEYREECLNRMRGALRSAVAERAPASIIINQIAEGWDGCMYDAPGETIDIGADIRATFERLVPGGSAALSSVTDLTPACAAPAPTQLIVGKEFLEKTLKHLEFIEQKTIYDARDLRDYIKQKLAAAPQPPAARPVEDVLAKLQTPEGVHANMLHGKIAKISMAQCAHTHGTALADGAVCWIKPAGLDLLKIGAHADVSPAAAGDAVPLVLAGAQGDASVPTDTMARRALAGLFEDQIGGRDFGTYIRYVLAGDFAFALAGWLARQSSALAAMAAERDAAMAQLAEAKAQAEASRGAICAKRWMTCRFGLDKPTPSVT